MASGTAFLACRQELLHDMNPSIATIRSRVCCHLSIDLPQCPQGTSAPFLGSDMSMMFGNLSILATYSRTLAATSVIVHARPVTPTTTPAVNTSAR